MYLEVPVHHNTKKEILGDKGNAMVKSTSLNWNNGL